MKWSEIKHAVNSTFTTSEFEPLNEHLKMVESGNYFMYGSDTVRHKLDEEYFDYYGTPGYNKNGESTQKLQANWVATHDGYATLYINYKIYGLGAATTTNFRVYRNGQCVGETKTFPTFGTGTNNKLDVHFERGDVITFDVVYELMRNMKFQIDICGDYKIQAIKEKL